MFKKKSAADVYFDTFLLNHVWIGCGASHLGSGGNSGGGQEEESCFQNIIVTKH